MVRMMRPSFAGLAGILLLAGCQQAVPSTAETFGDAVRQNMALHIVDPTPADLEHGPYDGRRRALAIERYQTDTVEEPEDVTASEVGEE